MTSDKINDMETTEKKQFSVHSVTANSYTVREDVMDGKKHWVVPVVMMVEGVHSGSKGPILHKGEELEKWTEAWDGIPVTISHPQKDKANVSANSPDVLDSASVGRIFNSHYDKGLKAEAWIDTEKLSAKSAKAYEAIENERPLEVSVGVFNDTEDTEGEWNGETYDSIAYNYRPDHLALLPEEIGACSWDDGCGIRVNKEGGVTVKDIFVTFQELNQKGYTVSLLNNEVGFREIQESLSAKLRDLDTDNSYHYIEEVYPDYIVYSKWSDGGGETLYKQSYEMDDNGNIVFNGMSSEVRKNVEYVTMSKMRRTKISNNNSKKGGNMSKDGSLCCEAKVDELIANKKTHWQATDREWLLEQDEATIAKMSPMAPEVVKPTAEEIQTNKDEAVSAFKEGLKTIEDYTALMPEAMKVQIDGGVKLYNEHRAGLVKTVLDNTAEGLWEEDVLKAMDDKTLENLSKSIKPPADYSAQGAGGGSAPSGEQVEVPVEYSRNGKEDK